MSKFRVPIAINIIDILSRNIGRKRRVNAVGHRASGRMPHVSLPVLLRHSKDVQICGESMAQRISVNVVRNACLQAYTLQMHPKFFGIELEKLRGFTLEHVA